METLPESERAAYSLTDTIDKLDTANSIETFFLERAKQLLKGGGVAAIILPSSVLSNGNSTYIRAREILLQYFDIVAIVEFGSGTFGKTGTNTVTLFLRRKPTAPDTASHYLDRLNEWFGTDEGQDAYRDEHLIDAYAAHIGVPAADYKGLLRGNAEGAWADHDHFEQYKKRFNDSGEVERLSKQRAFKALSDADKDKELRKRFLVFAHGIERDKLYNFVIASDQANPVLIVRSPNDNKAQRKFLGYEWSAAKGDEGIKIQRDNQNRHATALYDEINRSDATKVNHLISQNYEGIALPVSADLASTCTFARLPDMLDFGKATCDKLVSLAGKSATSATVHSKLHRLDDVAVLEKGVTYAKADQVLVRTSNIVLTADNVTLDGRFEVVKRIFLRNSKTFSDSKRLRSGDIFVCMSSGSRAHVGKLAYITKDEGYLAGGFMGILRAKGNVHSRVLFEVLNLPTVRSQFRGDSSGSNIQNLSSSIGELRIPIPSPALHAEIADACAKVDDDVSDSAASAAKSLSTVEELMIDCYTRVDRRTEIDGLAVGIQYGLSEKMNESGIGHKIFRMNEIVQRRMVDGGQMKCADISAQEFAKYKLNRGDLLFNRTNSIEHVGKTGLFDLDGDYCFASYLVRVVPDASKVLPQFLVLMMNSTAFQAEAKGKASKAINQANINATIMRNIKVPVPPLPEQKRLVAKVQALEKKIADAQAVIAGAPARKQAILQRYL